MKTTKTNDENYQIFLIFEISRQIWEKTVSGERHDYFFFIRIFCKIVKLLHYY